MTHQLPEPAQRIRLIEMPNDPCPVEAGSLGTILYVNEPARQIGVKWDLGRIPKDWTQREKRRRRR